MSNSSNLSDFYITDLSYERYGLCCRNIMKYCCSYQYPKNIFLIGKKSFIEKALKFCENKNPSELLNFLRNFTLPYLAFNFIFERNLTKYDLDSILTLYRLEKEKM
jgi:hypothetical protein